MSRPYVPLLVEDVNAGAANLASAIGLVTGTAALVGALISPFAGPLGDRVGFRRVLAALAPRRRRDAPAHATGADRRPRLPA